MICRVNRFLAPARRPRISSIDVSAAHSLCKSVNEPRYRHLNYLYTSYMGLGGGICGNYDMSRKFFSRLFLSRASSLCSDERLTLERSVLQTRHGS